MKRLTTTGKSSDVKRPEGLLNQIFVQEKLYNWVGVLFVAAIATLFGYLFAEQTSVGFSLLAFVVGFFTFMLCLVHAETGLYISIFYSYFAFILSRYFFNDQFPVGLILDFLLFATFLGLMKDVAKFRKNFASFMKTPIAIIMMVLVVFMFFQLFNFYGHSFEGWLQSFRRFLGSVFLLFISYYLFDDYKKLKRYLIAIFILSTITGAYGCFQEWFGLFQFEEYWVTSNENRFGLYYIMGDFRKFSTMSDPTAYAICMAISALIFIVMAWYSKQMWRKLVLAAGVMVMLLGMSYSGTRTANIMVAAGLCMFILLTINKKQTQLFAVVAALGFVVLMYGPYANTTIIRIRTSFNATEDASYNVREINRHFIQPYIWSHPIGGGLGTSGAAGLRFNPGHYLSGFPPDSGYVRKAVETGWVGLALIIVAYFSVMRFGIRGYFKSRHQNYKLLYAASLASIFSLYVGEVGQEAIGQITDIVIYYPLIAVMMKLRERDRKVEDRLSAETHMEQ